MKKEAKIRIKHGEYWFAYKKLFELILVSNPALYGQNCDFKNKSNQEKHESCYKTGFICEKEKNIIMEVIKEI